MLINADQLEDGSSIATEVCVVGAGPAGLTVAAQLVQAGIDTVVVEEGGLSQIGGYASFWAVEHPNGTGNHLRLMPFVEDDFMPRSRVSDEAWPIDARTLEPYFRRADRLFGLSPRGFDTAAWEQAGAQRLDLAEDEIVTGMYQFGDGRIIHQELRDAIVGDPHGRILYHAAARELTTSDDGNVVTGVAVATPGGRTIRVAASHVVLAAGALGTAHLLLLSDQNRPGGLGNDHDLVGRYLMDHPLVDGGDFVPSSASLLDAMALYDLRAVDGHPAMGHLRIARPALLTQGLLQLSAMLFPRESDHRSRYRLSPRQERAHRAAFEFRANLRSGGIRNWARLPEVLMGADGLLRLVMRDRNGRYPRLGRGGWSKMPRPSNVFGVFQVIHQVEQPPRRDNRVVLATAPDSWGRRSLERHWKWNDSDREAARDAQAFMAAALARAGLGEYRIIEDQGRPLLIAESAAHPMGTTRMHSDPKKGVVDADCRLHSAANVFIASSSTFVTGGFANPTLTVVALALRIADQLRATLRPGTDLGGVEPSAQLHPVNGPRVDADAVRTLARTALPQGMSAARRMLQRIARCEEALEYGLDHHWQQPLRRSL